MGVTMIRFPSVQKNADGLTKSERLRDRTVKAISRLAAIAGFALALGATDAFTTPASATAVDAPQARVLVLTLNGASDNLQMAQYHRSHMSHSSHSSHRSHYSSR